MGQHILVPVDGSPGSETALAYALEERPDARVTLLHVVNPVSSFGYGDEAYFDIEGYQAEARRQRDRGEQLLEEARETAAERGVDAETLLLTGKPATRILETIESHDVDHVVMGSRGRSGVGRVLFGSVAEAVTRRASVPVTVVR
jgi:nucleotide-binding universal stress UspA family protein